MDRRFDDRDRPMRYDDSRRRDERERFDDRSDRWQRHDMGVSREARGGGYDRDERPASFYDRDDRRDRRDERPASFYDNDRRHEERFRGREDDDRRYGGERGRQGDHRGYGGSYDDRRGRDDEYRRGAYEPQEREGHGRDHYRLRDDQRSGRDDRERYDSGRDDRGGRDRNRERDIIDRDEDGNYRYSGRDFGFSWRDGSNSATWGESDNWGNEYHNHSRGEGIGWNRGSTRDPRFWSTPDRDR